MAKERIIQLVAASIAVLLVLEKILGFVAAHASPEVQETETEVAAPVTSLSITGPLFVALPAFQMSPVAPMAAGPVCVSAPKWKSTMAAWAAGAVRAANPRIRAYLSEVILSFRF